MIYQGWFKTENDSEILLKYDIVGEDIEQRKINFINAVVIAEMRTGVIFILNEEGRQRVNETK